MVWPVDDSDGASGDGDGAGGEESCVLRELLKDLSKDTDRCVVTLCTLAKHMFLQRTRLQRATRPRLWRRLFQTRTRMELVTAAAAAAAAAAIAMTNSR